MPKLKAALGAQQAASQRRAAEAKRAANKAATASAPKRAVGEKRALKRQRRDKEAATRILDARAKLEEEEELEVAPEDLEAAERLAARLSSKAIIAIAPDDTVLLLGEANFSFARALVEGRGHAGHLVCATAFDPEDECYEKYPDCKENVELLRSRGVRVAFSVDAGALDKAHKVLGKGRRWSRIVFNFPHVGKGITDQDRNVRENQVLLLRTLKSVAPLLTEGPSAFPITIIKKGKGKGKAILAKKRPRAPSPESDDEAVDEDGEKVDRNAAIVPASFTPPQRQGSVLITLLNQAPYTLWEMPKLAGKPPPVCPGTKEEQPRYRLLRSFQFVPEAWPGYAHRRTIGWREGLSKAHNEEIVGRQGKARTWEFALWDGEDAK